MHLFLRFATVVLLVIVLTPPVSGQRSGQLGYLVTFYLLDGECRLSSTALIDNYVENRHVPDPGDWTVLLENDAGEAVWQYAVPNPRLFSPLLHPKQPIPFTVKIPDVGARTLLLRDEFGKTTVKMPLDERFLTQARVTRARFMQLDRENREAVRLRKSGPARTGRAVPPSEVQPIEEIRQPGDSLFEQELPEVMERLAEEDSASIGRYGRSGRLITPGLTTPAGTPEPVTNLVIGGTVTNTEGAPVMGAFVILRNLTSTTPLGAYWSASTNASGHFLLLVPSNLFPTSFLLCVSAFGYVRQSASVWVTQDVTRNVILETGKTVSGSVAAGQGQTVSGARVRALKEGVFIDSALTKSDGTYSFAIPPGTYDFEVLPPAFSNLAPAYQAAVPINQSEKLDFVLNEAQASLVVRLLYPDEQSYLLTQSLVKRFEIRRAGSVVAVTYGTKGTAGFDAQKGQYFVPYTLFPEPGEYDVTCYPIGHDPVQIRAVEVAGQTSVDCDLDKAITWSAVLRGADGSPLPDLIVRSYDDLTSRSTFVRTDALGRFTIPLTPNGLVQFPADAGSQNILHVERLGPVLVNRVEDCVLGSFPALPESGEVLTQIYGTSDRSNRLNIVILGDGYTGVNETYTDVNGNGQWDGAVYYDLNNNRVWNTGEPYRSFGEKRLPPTDGTDPTIENEPFEDLNQDGVLNIDDQSLFDKNCLDVARSIFGQDFWQTQMDAFNIFKIRVVSRQAGHDIRDKDSRTVFARDTALGTFVSDPNRGYLLNGDASLISFYINQYVPEIDVRVVLLNQPITMGRPTSYIFLRGGDVSDLHNSVIIAHEMGHNPGSLADEYTEFQSNYTGIEQWRPNVTTQTDPDRIPWRSLLTPGKEIPSFPGSSGVGLFEGAAYFTGGCYRPTYNCLMVSGSRFCPVCERTLQVRLMKLTGRFPVPVPLAPYGPVATLRPSFKWQSQAGVSAWRLEIEPLDGTDRSQVYDVYATSFRRPAALLPRTLYRWRIRPEAESVWGDWSEWVYFQTQQRQRRSPVTTVR